jgi:hypothetical protein
MTGEIYTKRCRNVSVLIPWAIDQNNRRGSYRIDARVLTTLTLWAIQAIPTSLDFLTKMFNQAQTPSMSTYS